MAGRGIKIILFVALFVFPIDPTVLSAQDKIGKISKICLDAGHGGADAGACGRYTKEKDIALAVVLKLGKMISDKYPDVEVVYTRKTDVFIELTRRTEIANSCKADLFISVHLNSAPSSSATGIETLVLGTNNRDLNMQTAIRENSALMYESDYSVTKETFDPSAPESYIIFNLIRNVHLNESLELASCVQNSLIKETGRRDRKVKQQPLWVLKDASMPAILVEIGFISNLNEERTLRSEYDQKRVASAICQAFGEYKTKVEKDSRILKKGTEISDQKNISETSLSSSDWFYAVQIASFARPIDNLSKKLGISEKVDYIIGDGRYRYYVGPSRSYQEAVRNMQKVQKKIKDAFLIAVKDGKMVNVETLRKIEK